MSDREPWGTLPPFKSAPLPPLLNMFTALSLGVIFMAVAQGSGELIWWPYITGLTMGLAEAGPLILLSAVIGFVGTVLFSVALIFLNHVYLPRHLPAMARPGAVNLWFLIVSCAVYFTLAILYIATILGYQLF